MYWYTKSDDECVGYNYNYFEFNPKTDGLEIKAKYVLTQEEFTTWYELNKRL